MATLTPNKTLQADLLPLQNVAASTVVVGMPFDFSSKLGGAILARFGRRSASASTGSAYIRIETSNAESENNAWFPLFTLVTNYAAVESEAVVGIVNSDTNVITVASTTGLAAGSAIFLSNSTGANSEFGRVKSIVTNTSVIIEDNLVNAQTGSTLYGGTEIYDAQEIGAPYKRIRAVFDGSRFTQACAVQVSLVTVDGMSIA